MTTENQEQLLLTDDAIIRFVGIFQEAICLGIDGADLFRQVRLTRKTDESGTWLVLTDEYKTQVIAWHKKLNEQAQDLQSKQEFLDSDGSSYTDESGSEHVGDLPVEADAFLIGGLIK